MSESFFDHQGDAKQKSEVPDLQEAGSSDEKATSSEQFQTEEGRMGAIMAYIPILCFVPLLNMKENKEAMTHARQGVILFVIEVIALFFLIDGVSDFVFKGILIIAVALAVVGIYFALQGKNYRLPVIGDLAEKAKWSQ